MKVANSKARSFVQLLKPFTGNNTFAEVRNGVYVVFSYGDHFPLFVYLNGVWFENEDKFSRSTSKQQGQLHPLCDTQKLSTKALQSIYSN